LGTPYIAKLRSITHVAIRMPSFLVSSHFLHRLDDPNCLAVGLPGPTVSGLNPACKRVVPRIAPGDILFIWGGDVEGLASYSIVERSFDPALDTLLYSTDREAPMVIGKPMPLATRLSKKEFHDLCKDNPFDRTVWRGHQVFRRPSRFDIHFTFSAFCYGDLPAAMLNDLHSRLPHDVLLTEQEDDDAGDPASTAETGAGSRTHNGNGPRRLRRGPRPTSWTTNVERNVDGKAYTYLLRFGDHDLWKIGWSTDIDRRRRDINAYIPWGLLEERWQIHEWRLFPSQQEAWEAEQAFIDHLERRHIHQVAEEQFACGAGDVHDAWAMAVHAKEVQTITPGKAPDAPEKAA
jgi:hypothetical protein